MINTDTETARNPEKLERIVIEPLTRVEGHGKVTLLQDENKQIKQARLHIVEFRGFEKFCVGRSFWEMPGITARICGICPVSHLMASSKTTILWDINSKLFRKFLSWTLASVMLRTVRERISGRAEFQFEDQAEKYINFIYGKRHSQQ